MELTLQLAAYNALLEKKDQLAKETTENNKAIDQARHELSNLMLDAELERVTFEGYNFTLAEKVAYSKRAATEAALFDALREDGLGDIIRETVNPRTLQSVMKDLAEQNDGDLPPQYDGLITAYRYMDVSRRKK